MREHLGTPAYLALAEDLRRKIEAGEYRTGEPLPSATELMASYKVSSTVIKNAMRELRASGHVNSQQGKAVFAALPTGPAWLAELIDAGMQLADLARSAGTDADKAAADRWEQAMRAVPENQLRRAD